MLSLLWAKGLLRRRTGRLLGCSAGVALAVALLSSLGAFLASASAAMTRRAVADVAVDWQVGAGTHADPTAVLNATRDSPGVRVALPVDFAQVEGFEATTGATTQSTGAGVVLGIPHGYAEAFPGALRTLSGSSQGVVLTQQTAANLHATVGDTVRVAVAGQHPAVRVAGVVDLPSADSLFQRVGAPPGGQLSAPPDNVVLLPSALWSKMFGRLAHNRPDLVEHQVHAGLDHRLPRDPAVAFNSVTGRARNLEARLSGAGLVGDNLAVTLDAARKDALYAQVLFLLLGIPGAVLAGLLTRSVAAAGAGRHRHDSALLRARGATAPRLARLLAVEGVLVASIGGLTGLAAGALVGRSAFGSASFGATPSASLAWSLAAVATGALIALFSVVWPARREARAQTVATARVDSLSTRRPAVLRYGLDVAFLAAGGVAFWLTSRTGYQIVLVPEGVPTVSVSYAGLLGPALFWVGGGLFMWRVVDELLRRRSRLVRGLVRPVAGPLRGTVVSSMSRERAGLTHAVVLFALALAFAASTAIFNATYLQQVGVDARLTNGADVLVTEPPSAHTSGDEAARLGAVSGVRRVEPMMHRFAYVGPDLQDLYGVRATTVGRVTRLQDAYFRGGSASSLMSALQHTPDGLLVSAETVHDFQLVLGDRLNLRLRDRNSGRLVPVSFRYLGVATEFPTAPHDSFLVANADYVAGRTQDLSYDTFLLDVGASSPGQVADRTRQLLGGTASVTDIAHARHLAGSSLTAVNLAGLTRVELGFALVLAAAAAGLVLALGQAERRRALAVIAGLGARPRQLGAFVRGEAIVVTAVGTCLGAAAGYGLALALVKVLTGVFDPPPSVIAFPWVYLAGVVAAAVIASTLAAETALRLGRRHPATLLRDV